MNDFQPIYNAARFTVLRALVTRALRGPVEQSVLVPQSLVIRLHAAAARLRSRPLTQTQTLDAIRALGMTCRVDAGEYCVNYRSADERTAYHTNDPQDALNTAVTMRYGPNAVIDALQPRVRA